MAGLLQNIVYFQDHEALLKETLDQVIAQSVNEDDQPAFAFAALVDALGRDTDKAVTIAALAVMRLANVGGERA
jgi:hypothetical protein